MKPILQQLPLPKNSSFIAKTFTTAYFETGWHQHAEYELILFTEGSGLAFIGKHVAKFEPGDFYFLGKNLPHTFQKKGNQVTSAVVVQFKDDCWGNQFLNMAECRSIKQLLEMSCNGLMLTGNSKNKLSSLIKALETAVDANRIILLLQCLQIIAAAKEYIPLTALHEHNLSYEDGEWIDKILRFTLTAFRDSVSLPQVASIACMSVPSFCHYFKRRTQKTYINFLNEVRVSYACRQLLETDKSIADICYDSGYNTVAHFHRQFMRLKKTTPLQYRKTFSLEKASIN